MLAYNKTLRSCFRWRLREWVNPGQIEYHRHETVSTSIVTASAAAFVLLLCSTVIR